ncbi:TolC family protein [Bacteroides sp.]|uniref:TolC family protein n=1 Tax=Bacteroides sp. TaxID=29523 RepID=UPI00262D83B9|nr:TolC family protein [Bacteroides sp.]MDD3037752.1 TolC family protein [Bacteroides sp.]
MKYFKASIVLLLLLLAPIKHIAAQEVSSNSNYNKVDYSNIILPPLDVLFENAKNTPIYEMADVKAAIERKLLTKEKRAFLGFFSLRGSYQYGMFGNESTYTDVAISPYLSYSTQAQNGYTLGAGINIPLDQLFDLKPRVTRQKLALRSAELEREIKYDEIKREIIQMYAMATSQLQVLQIRSESLVLATVQYEISEKNFANGTIESSELSVDKERQSKAREAFESSKFELTKSLMILEVISRTSIIKHK